MDTDSSSLPSDYSRSGHRRIPNLRSRVAASTSAAWIGLFAIAPAAAVASGTKTPTKEPRPQQSLTIKGKKDAKPQHTLTVKGKNGQAVVLNNPDVTVQPKQSTAVEIISVLEFPLVMIGFIAALTYTTRRRLGGGKKAKAVEKPNVHFSDIGGHDEAKADFADVVEMLRNRKKYSGVGARLPRGMLLTGPPGVGKTLFARAVAGEAKASFFAMAGSEFDEALVGIGAGRIRSLFKQARANQPAVIFIDELDSIGGKRERGIDAGPWVNQTQNQLLTELNGFREADDVMVIAATNLPDHLDGALTRPGRFDRQVRLALPTLAERRAIIKIHAKGKTFADEVDFDSMARRTEGMSGAQLENILNEAAR